MTNGGLHISRISISGVSLPPAATLPNVLNTVSSALNTVEHGEHHSPTHVAQAWRRTQHLPDLKQVFSHTIGHPTTRTRPQHAG